jgi:hypothetical protein
VDRINAELTAEGRPPFQFKTIPQGAATSVWAAVVAPAEDVGGRYCEDCQVSQVTEGLISPVSPGVRPYALARSTPRRSGPRARRWWASDSDHPRLTVEGRTNYASEKSGTKENFSSARRNPCLSFRISIRRVPRCW